MDPTLVVAVVAVAAISLLPAWLTGMILKKHAKKEGAGGMDWLPFGLLPYALTRFKHPNKVAIVWGYLFSNLLFLAALVVLIIQFKNRTP